MPRRSVTITAATNSAGPRVPRGTGVARYGPVTLADVAWWTGLAPGRCRAALDELGNRLTRVGMRGWDGEHLVLWADLDPRAARGRIAGVWNVLADRQEARFHPVAPGHEVDERIRVELAAMAFITGSAVTVRQVDRMTPLTDRSAGWGPQTAPRPVTGRSRSRRCPPQ